MNQIGQLTSEQCYIIEFFFIIAGKHCIANYRHFDMLPTHCVVDQRRHS